MALRNVSLPFIYIRKGGLIGLRKQVIIYQGRSTNHISQKKKKKKKTEIERKNCNRDNYTETVTVSKIHKDRRQRLTGGRTRKKKKV